MPQRFLRPGITNSDRWNSVPWDAQSLYIRLLTIVDDYGRMDGRPGVVWAQCFAVWNEKNPEKQVTREQVGEMLENLSKKGTELIDIYTAEGKTVLQITLWQERVRANAKLNWPGKPIPQKNPAESCGILPPSSPSLVPRPVPSSPSERMRNPAESGLEKLKTKISDVYGSRRHWSSFEESTLAEIVRERGDPEAELDAILAYRAGLKRDDQKYFPQSVSKLLEKWGEILDRAHSAKAGPAPKKSIGEQDIDRMLRQAERSK